jgi:xylulokinase
MKQVFAGIDLGTSSVKVDITDAKGQLLAEHSLGYSTSSPEIGWAEQDPEEWWQAAWSSLCSCVADLRAAQDAFELKGIGVTGQMHSSVLLGADGNPLGPAIVWMDARARELMPEINDKLQQTGLYSVLKNTPAPGLTLGPLVWMRKHRPKTLDSAAQLLIAKDYIRYRLSGELATDITDASGTLMLDMNNRAWSSAVCDTFNLPSRIFPEIKHPAEIAGRLRAELVAELALSAAPVVAVGCSDQAAAAVGAGVLHPGLMQLMLGTGAQIMTPLSSGKVMPPRSLNMFCLHDLWCLQGSIQNAGSALNWVRSTFRADWAEVMQAATERPGGPLFLPYLTGERAPIMDEQASGAFLGVRYGAGREHMLFAVIEGVVHGICDAVDEIDRVVALPQDESDSERVHVPGLSEIRCGGGGAGQDAYVQLLADYLGRPLSVLDRSGSTALGAAMLGAVAAGAYLDPESASAEMGLKVGKVLEPNLRAADAAAERRSEYRFRRDHNLQAERLLRERPQSHYRDASDGDTRSSGPPSVGSGIPT